MTILVVLFGLLISHLVFPLARWRQFDLLLWPAHWARRHHAEAAWSVTAAVMLTAIGVALAAGMLAEAWLGQTGWFVMALAMFVYTLGPRDLDRDVQALLLGGQQPRYLKARRIMRLRSDAGAVEAAAAILRAAQARWFGILFWFVVLGMPGALLYRLTRISLHEAGLDAAQSASLLRLRSVLDWPVLVLLLVSAALAGDFDRVRRAWRAGHRPWSDGWLDARMLDRVAATWVGPDQSFADGVQAGHRLVWRMLLIWLVALSLLLILGWLS